MFYLMVSASGVDVRSEVLNYKGRMDMMIAVNNIIYIIEFKCNQSADSAIKQIFKKEYHKAFVNKGKEIIILGINFSVKERNINDWIYEML